jgi:hypothetical protein
MSIEEWRVLHKTDIRLRNERTRFAHEPLRKLTSAAVALMIEKPKEASMVSVKAGKLKDDKSKKFLAGNRSIEF